MVGSADASAKARLELARIGFDEVLGYIDAETFTETQQLSQLSVCDLKGSLKRDGAPQVLDVRRPGERKAGHLEGAQHIPLPGLTKALGEVPKDKPVAVICGSGYRSSIAASLLLARGFARVQSVMGGLGAHQETKCAEWQAADLVFEGKKRLSRAVSRRARKRQVNR